MQLNPEIQGDYARAFEDGLNARVVGQERAVRALVSFYQVFKAELHNPSRPLGTLLFLGPTGSGKTHVVEAAADVIFGDPNAVIKIDCAEFQHSHEISKLTGSPPGYIGHRETQPLLTQENLDRFQTSRDPFTFVLFDEIEKASSALWQLLLGVLERASLTLGDTRRVDFSRAMIIMTSNLGAREMKRLLRGGLGFAPAAAAAIIEENLNQKIHETAMEAAKRKFLPEFMNRIDKTITFHSLNPEQLEQILTLELNAVQRRIKAGKCAQFKFETTERVRRFLLDEGTNLQYGARQLKRVIEQFVVTPFANLLVTEQVQKGDEIVVDFDPNEKRVLFNRTNERALGVHSPG